MPRHQLSPQTTEALQLYVVDLTSILLYYMTDPSIYIYSIVLADHHSETDAPGRDARDGGVASRVVSDAVSPSLSPHLTNRARSHPAF